MFLSELCLWRGLCGCFSKGSFRIGEGRVIYLDDNLMVYRMLL